MPDLPTGTVTFLFTDIEGSTSLAQQYPAELPALLARHHAILHQAIQAHNGHVFQITGDAFCSAFYTASDALMAALDAQHAMQHERWDPAPIKVRMGIHTGAAQAGAIEERAGGYVGYLTLTRVQRVMSTAYGEQVLVSNTTAELARSELPADVTLRDMSEHHLKGLLNSEHLWQLVAPDLRQDFPSLQSLNAIPNNLPQQLTSFVGRERELAEIKHLLFTTHLLTLTGSGGTGKTRLSLQTAAGVLETFADGVWFIELAPIAEPALVPQAVAIALGIREMPGQSALDLLIDFLRSKQLLLILDNCEHLVDACAQLADQLLRACPNLRILASSREALGIAGEHAYRVPSLSIAELHQATTFDIVQHNDCARLFVERAAAAQAGFRLTEKNAAPIAQICLRLDGIPLAVELAAARVKAFSPDQIAVRLDDRFRLLTGGSRTALPRQQTLRALIDWSYDLLPNAERLLLRRLPVFAGGWTFDAAEAVCAGDGLETFGILDLHAHLVDKSLVTLDESDEANARYFLLETIRQYARDKLLDSGEMITARDRHLQYFLEFGEEAWTNYSSAQQSEWSRRVREEEDNVRAALEWGMEHQPEAVLRLGGALSPYWALSGYACSEGVRWLELGLERVALLSPTEGAAAREWQLNRARAQLALAVLMSSLGDAVATRRYAEECLPIWREFEMKREWGWALMQISISSQYFGNASTAIDAVKESIAMFRAQHEVWMLALALGTGASVILRMEHDIASARSYLEESIALFQRLGDEQNAALPLWVLGELEYVGGNYQQARAAFESSLAGSLAAGQRQRVNMARSGIASAEWKLGHGGAALKLFGEVIAEWDRIGNRGGMARCFECVAFILLDQAASDPAFQELLQRAARLLGAAEHQRETSHAGMNPIEQAEYGRAIASLRQSMDETTLKARWAEGRALSQDESIELATTSG